MSVDVIAAPVRASRGRLRRSLAFARNLMFGTLCATNPVTAVLLLGWLQRRMRWRMGHEAAPPNWLIGENGRLAGALWSNLKAGVAAALALAAITLPATGAIALAWWAGWENSFGKGYEQAAFGPLISFAAMAALSLVLCFVPMALAHQSASGHWRGFFRLGEVRGLIARAGWRYPVLLTATAIAGLPLLLLHMLPVFIENIVPGFAQLPPGEAAVIATWLTLAGAAYVFLSLWLLRGSAARIHQRAESRLKPPVLALRVLYGLLGFAASLALVMQIYVAQFFNFAWLRWLTQPAFLLPWLG